MDDRFVEELLRRSWSPKPPDGLRERVLRRTAQGAARRSAVSRWKLALAGLGLAAVILTNLANFARDNRIAAMLGERRSSSAAMRESNLCELTRELARVHAQLMQGDGVETEGHRYE